jgi:hypothetical protein
LNNLTRVLPMGTTIRGASDHPDQFGHRGMTTKNQRPFFPP